MNGNENMHLVTFWEFDGRVEEELEESEQLDVTCLVLLSWGFYTYIAAVIGECYSWVTPRFNAVVICLKAKD